MDTLFQPFLAMPDPFLIPIVAIICGTLIAITAIIRGKSPPSDQPEDEEASRTIQEIYSQCNRLADRIEALETIILENEKRNKS
jgi:phage shock protein B